MRVLLIEDHLLLSKEIASHLARRAIVVDVVDTAEEATAALAATAYDLVILDLGLSNGRGRTLLQSVTADIHSPPMIVITAQNSVAERLASLNGGADDCLAKPV